MTTGPLTPRALLGTFEAIDTHSLADSVLKSSLRRTTQHTLHEQLLIARSLLFSESGITSRDKGARRFSFRTRSGRLEWGSIEGLDLDRILRDGIVEKVEPLIDNIAFAEVSLDPFVKYATPEFIKAFQVSQMIVEYLRFQAETLVSKILHLNDEYSQANAEHEREKIVWQERESAKDGEIVVFKKHIQKATDEMQVILKEYTRLDQLVKKYSKNCPVCERLFFQPINLEKHILQRHPAVSRNVEVHTLMEDFSKLVGPSSDIYRAEKIEKSLQEIQGLRNSLMEETRRIREKDALIEQKLEATLQGQEKERKQALQDFERAQQEQERRYEEELRKLQQKLSSDFQSQIQELKEVMEEDASRARQDELDRLTANYEARIEKLNALLREQQEENQRMLRDERGRGEEEHQKIQEHLAHERQKLARMEEILRNKEALLTSEQENRKKMEETLRGMEGMRRMMEENQRVMEENLRKMEENLRKMGERERRLEAELQQARARIEQLLAELEILESRPEPVAPPPPPPPIIVEPPPKPPEPEEIPVKLPRNAEFSPLAHRSYLKTLFPYTSAEVAYSRNELLQAIQREMVSRNVQLTETGGITKNELARLMSEMAVLTELTQKSRPDLSDLELFKQEIFRDLEIFSSRYSGMPPLPPPSPSPSSFLSRPSSPPFPPSSSPSSSLVPGTPPLFPPLSPSPSTPPARSSVDAFSEERRDDDVSSVDSQQSVPKRRKQTRIMEPIPEHDEFDDAPAAAITPITPVAELQQEERREFSPSPVFTRKQNNWRMATSEQGDDVVEMGDSQDSLVLSPPEDSSYSSPTDRAKERDKPRTSPTTGRVRNRHRAADPAQQDLIAELQRHNRTKNAENNGEVRKTSPGFGRRAKLKNNVQNVNE